MLFWFLIVTNTFSFVFPIAGTTFWACLRDFGVLRNPGILATLTAIAFYR